MSIQNTPPAVRNWKSAPVTLSPEMRRVRDLAMAEQKPQCPMGSAVGYVNHVSVQS